LLDEAGGDSEDGEEDDDELPCVIGESEVDTNMIIHVARFRESRYLVRESEVFIKDKTKVASRVSSNQ